ncbi:MAG: ATP-binding protein, partial [Planctomycetota bacterium]
GRPTAPSTQNVPAEPATVAILSARLESGPNWYNFYILAAPVPWIPLLISRSIDTFLTVLITVVVIILTGRIMRPLRRLVVNADRFGRGEDIGRIEPEGSADVRETIEAFNRMAGRVTQTLDYQVALTHSLGHDLKGPLHRVVDDAADAKPPELRDRLLGRLDQIENSVEAISTFARATRRDGQSVRIDLPSLLEVLVEEEVDAGREASIVIGAQAIVRGRHNALVRAFANLIENAIKYGGSARVTLFRDRADVVVQIDDDGPGIRPDQIDAAFRPFERLSARRPGTGLGLSIVRTIIVDHGGAVTLHNRPEGGLRATVRLPPEPTDH